MKTLSITLKTLALALLLSGCAYTARVADIPVFEERGDFQASAGGSLTEGFTLSAASAVTDHFAMQVSSSWCEGFSQVRGTLGLYYPKPNHTMLAFYAGYGVEVDDGYYTDDNGASQPRTNWATTYFGQVDYGWRPTSWCTLAGRMSGGFLCWQPRDFQGVLYWEPALMASFGWEHWTFDIKGSIRLFKGSSHYAPFKVPFTIGAGVSYRFNANKKK